jgi:hypothetical protein
MMETGLREEDLSLWYFGRLLPMLARLHDCGLELPLHLFGDLVSVSVLADERSPRMALTKHSR